MEFVGKLVRGMLAGNVARSPVHLSKSRLGYTMICVCMCVHTRARVHARTQRSNLPGKIPVPIWIGTAPRCAEEPSFRASENSISIIVPRDENKEILWNFLEIIIDARCPHREVFLGAETPREQGNKRMIGYASR